jgi:hypothetical protein
VAGHGYIECDAVPCFAGGLQRISKAVKSSVGGRIRPVRAHRELDLGIEAFLCEVTRLVEVPDVAPYDRNVLLRHRPRSISRRAATQGPPTGAPQK